MRVRLEDDSVVEIIENEASGQFFSNTQQDITNTLDHSLDRVVKFAKESLSKLRDEVAPDEVEIEFGAEAGGEGGVFGIAKAHATATMIIRIKWKKS